MHIEIISGSPRKNSQTKRVAIHLFNRLRFSDDNQVGLISLDEITLPPVENVFASELDAPLEIRRVAERIFRADAFILVSPEYNGSYSPAMKNLLDHFPKQAKKTFGLVTASPGALGGIRAALQLQSLTYGLMGIGSPQMLVVPELDRKFDNEGRLLDQSFKTVINSFLESFLWLATSVSISRVSQVERKCA